MARTGSGVEVRKNSIRVQFVFEGKTHRHTLTVEGAPLPPTPANIKYAARLVIEIREKIKHDVFLLQEYFPDAAQTRSAAIVAEQLDNWISTQRLTDSSFDSYMSAIRFWKNAPCTKDSEARLGDMPLRSLKLSHILTATASRPDLTGKTLNNYVSVLSPALQLAVEDGVLDANPAEKVQKFQHQKARPDPFTHEEVKRITAHMRARYPAPVANMVEFWFFTGLRTSELVGLRWSNVDLASGVILITQGIVRRKEKDSTKTSVARKVRLDSRALAAITRQREHTHLTGEHVFLRPQQREAGRPGPAAVRAEWYDERAFTEGYWKPTLKHLKIRYRRPYCMRHTRATMMLMAGLKPAYCAKQLGHSKMVFLEIYADWIDDGHDELEMARLEQHLASFIPGTSPERKKA
jgi:integrase